MNTLKRLLYFATAIFILFSCRNKQEPPEQEPGLIEITSQQFNTVAMQLGEIEIKTFESTVQCNGTLVPLPNGMAKVNATLSGVIKNIYCHNGQFVEKNQTLLEITGNEIIDIQKDFAEASANYKRLKNEYERVKSLYNDKVTSEKDFIITESEFKSSMAKYNGLKLKIEAIGLSISKIENGEFYSSYTIKTPINGFISSLKANIGSYIDSQSELIEIINPTMFQVQLSVFATDIKNLKKGQTVRFKSVNSKTVQFATITSLGMAVDNNSKSIECYASITDKKPSNPIANDFVECEIITSADTANAVPSDAIIKSETGYFILVLNKQEDDKYLFNKVEVSIGRQYDGYTEIPGEKIEGKILVKGVYNISI